jgi:peptidyl-prolyl cis-trans isomerase B (cyclophilin B)
MLLLEGRLISIMKGKKMSKNPIATITMENEKSITIELYPEIAPDTVNNFISLIKKKFYDGLLFHRVIADFMIQGGCPEGTGAGGPGYKIKGEFLSNGFKNDLKHKEGVISMARSSEPDSAGSQFFIMHKYAQHLDGNYAAFGKVIEGMDEVDRMVNVKKDRNDKPIISEIIKEITVDCFGENYPEPEAIID